MARYHGKGSRVFVNALHASGQVSEWSASKSADLSPCTGLLSEGGETTVGHTTGKISIKGYLDTDVGTLLDSAATSATTAGGTVVTILPEGLTVSEPAILAAATVGGLAADSSVSATAALSVDLDADGSLDLGVILHPHSAATTDTAGASVDAGAGTANGGVATLHVSAYSGLTSAVIRVEHSTNGSVWSTLATFATVTAVGAERLAVAAGTTVNRYTRAYIDVTGSGSVTALVAFARR